MDRPPYCANDDQPLGDPQHGLRPLTAGQIIDLCVQVLGLAHHLLREDERHPQTQSALWYLQAAQTSLQEAGKLVPPRAAEESDGP